MGARNNAGIALGTTNLQPNPDYFDVKLTIVVSFLAWPILYVLNNGFENAEKDNRTLIMMVAGFGLLFAMTWILAKISRLQDWEGYIFMLFAFTAMIDTIIAIEFNGFISGFMFQYLALGEPYLHSPWGSAITLFDGIGLYLMYLVLIHLMSNGKPWRSLGIYWASSIINSMIVLLLGIFAGQHAPTWCTFMNIPYALIPLIIIIQLFRPEILRPEWSQESVPGTSTGKIFDILMALGLMYSIWITFTKGMLCLGSNFPIFLQFLGHEPALLNMDPAPFAKIQSFVYLFYALPIQLIFLFYIFQKRKPSWLWDLALINAGLFLQAQFTFICTALDPQTKEGLRSDWKDWEFWGNNLSILIIPHVFLGMLYNNHHLKDCAHQQEVKKNK